MPLVLDIGNTNLRWALSDGGPPGEVRVLRHGGAVPLDLLADWERLAAPERVVASNVECLGRRRDGRTTQAYWGLDVEFVRTRPHFGALRIAYADPERFGVDRWLALVAAHRLVPDAALVVDAGNGGHLRPPFCRRPPPRRPDSSGSRRLMRASLLAGTRIPRIESEPTDEPW